MIDSIIVQYITLWITNVSARTGKVAVSKYELLTETTIYEPGMTWSGDSGEQGCQL